jgi:AraC-like DNA-binding protein
MTQLPPRQTVSPGRLPRHRHAEAYAAVVLSGAYEEAGDAGRRRVGPGDVVVHRAFEAHLNRTPPAGAQVLNLPLPRADLPAFGRVDDVDSLVRAAEQDLPAAGGLLATAFRPCAAACDDWPDVLAAALAAGDGRRLADWASAFGVSPEHLSRGFGQVFGVTPQRYRLEARARAAIGDLARVEPLAQVALTHGFADQAHMSRAVRAVAGRPPGVLRRSNPFKT